MNWTQEFQEIWINLPWTTEESTTKEIKDETEKKVVTALEDEPNICEVPEDLQGLFNEYPENYFPDPNNM